jgi:hypothetical protein
MLRSDTRINPVKSKGIKNKRGTSMAAHKKVCSAQNDANSSFTRTDARSKDVSGASWSKTEMHGRHE